VKRGRATRPGPGPGKVEAPGSSILWDNGDGTFTARDLDLGIFIYMRALDDQSLDIRVIDAVKLGPAQHDVIFYGEYATARRLELEFVNGYAVPCIKWCAAQRNLKRLIRRFVDERAGQGRREQRR
jgi:hypothetical protein